MRNIAWIASVAMILGFVACGGEPASYDGDGPLDDIAEPGKADLDWGECEVREVLGFVNDLSTTAEVLHDAGVHTRASNNIVAYRDGLDELAGTQDDNYFADIEELDGVYYVGPVAMAQLVEVVRERCQVSPQAEVIFSPQVYADSHLARAEELIGAAEHSIDLAIYSFSDYSLMDALAAAVQRGVSVRVLFETAHGDHLDPEGSRSARLEDSGIDVRYINKIMHHKFAIFDGPVEDFDAAYTATLMTGSGNWSNSAGTRYDENTVILTGHSELLLRFQKEFNHLWANSRDLEWNDELVYYETIPVVEEAIVDNPNVDAVFTSANFRTYVSATYGPTFSVIAGENAVMDRLIGLVDEATESIHIASGHFRLRGLAEALMAKAAAHPEMDIRVYLDNQEYISEWYNSEQEADLADCLVNAGDSESAIRSCNDRGFYFSYPLYEAGIDLRFKYYCYRWHYTYAAQMHHKYLIFDGRLVASGSYNLSDNAEHNTMENMVIYDANTLPDLVQAFEDNFEKLWVTGEADDLHTALVNEITGTAPTFPIVFDAMALTWPEVNALKGLIYDNCPDINSDDFRAHPEDHTYCAR
jgi:phosphatidylserine/phosphatidylglycerophosphate/cardiolipin synthase-like enzyme